MEVWIPGEKVIRIMLDNNLRVSEMELINVLIKLKNIYTKILMKKVN